MDPEPGTAPRLHMAFRDSGRAAAHHRCGTPLTYGLVDCRINRLLDGVTSLSTPGLIVPPSVPNIKVIAGGMPPDSILEEFLGLTRPTGNHRGAQHNIRTTPGPPVACRLARPLGRGQGRIRHHAAGLYSPTLRGTVVVRPPSRARGQRLETQLATTEHTTLAPFLKGN
jgi:hypothetical protein